MNPSSAPAASPRRRLVSGAGWLIAALVLLGIAWRVLRYWLAFPIWGDEAFVAVNFVARDYGGMIQPLEYGQIVPLLFMWAELAVARAAGLGEHALRLLPLLAGIAALLLFVRFARDAVATPAAVVAIGILAASYYAVRHGAEVKPYTFDLLMAVVLLLLGWRVLRPDRPSHDIAAWGLLLLLAVVAPWLSYPSIFMGGSLAIVMLVRAARHASDRPLLLPALLFGGLLAASFAAMYHYYGGPHAKAAAQLIEIRMWAKTFPPVDLLTQGWDGIKAFPLRLAGWFYYIHTGNMFAYPAGGEAPGSLATFILVVIGALRLRRSKPQLAALLLLPLVLTFIAAAFKRYPYGGSVRTSIYMAPAFCLLAGVGAVALVGFVLRSLGANRFVNWDNLRTADRRVMWAGGLGMIAVIAIGAARDIREPFKEKDVLLGRETVRRLAASAQPADRWVVFNSIEKVEWAAWLGDLHGGGQFVFDVLRFHKGGTAWGPHPESVICPPGGRLVFFVYRGVKGEPTPEELLNRYLEVLRGKCGEPTFERTQLKERDGRIEAIDVYTFPRSGG